MPYAEIVSDNPMSSYPVKRLDKLQSIFFLQVGNFLLQNVFKDITEVGEEIFDMGTIEVGAPARARVREAASKQLTGTCIVYIITLYIASDALAAIPETGPSRRWLYGPFLGEIAAPSADIYSNIHDHPCPGAKVG